MRKVIRVTGITLAVAVVVLAAALAVLHQVANANVHHVCCHQAQTP